MKVCRKFFNLVEITLAMAVVGIGVAGIMAMFPPAVEASRNAIAENYAADTSNTMMAYIERAVKADWAAALSGFPSSPPTIANNNQVLNFGSWDEPVETTLSRIKGDVGTEITAGSVYGIKKGSDFVAHAKIWKEAIPDFYYNDGSAGSNETLSTGYGIRICMELSWPVMKPYSEREKKVYVMELRNPNPPNP